MNPIVWRPQEGEKVWHRMIHAPVTVLPWPHELGEQPNYGRGPAEFYIQYENGGTGVTPLENLGPLDA